MSAEMIIGLRISLIGLGVTFLALGLLSIVMKYLPILFPVRHAKTVKAVPFNEEQNDQQMEELAVALAVSLCLLEEHNALTYQDPNLGKLLEAQ